MEGINSTQEPYKELENSLDPDKIKHWREAADSAASERGDKLDIYTLKMEKG